MVEEDIAAMATTAATTTITTAAEGEDQASDTGTAQTQTPSSTSSAPSSEPFQVLAIMPLDNQAQQQILSQNQLTKRLEAIARILGFMKRRGCF